MSLIIPIITTEIPVTFSVTDIASFVKVYASSAGCVGTATIVVTLSVLKLYFSTRIACHCTLW